MLRAEELEKSAHWRALSLRRLGVDVGDAVVASGLGQLDALMFTLGALRAGVSVLPLPALSDVTRFAAVVRNVRPRLVCVESAAPDIRSKASELGCLVVDATELAPPPEPQDGATTAEVELPTVSGVVLGSVRREAPVRPTVGHDAAAASQAWSFRLRFDLPERGRHLAAVPFWHLVPLTVALGALFAGHDVVLAAETAEDVWRQCELSEATSMFVVPGVLAEASAREDSGGRSNRLVSVISGIRPCPPGLQQAAEAALGPVLYESYSEGDRRCLVTPAPSDIHQRVGIWSLAAARGEEIAVLEHDGRAVSRAELVESALLLANALADSIAPGSVVVSALANSADAVIAYLATVLGGFAYLPMGADLPLPRLRELCALHRPELLLGDDNGPAPEGVPLATVASLVAARRSPPPGGHPGDGFMLALTSGSTGLPKAVRRRSGSMNPTLRAVVESSLSRWMEMPTTGPHLVTGPLSGGAFWSTAIAALHSGQTLLLMRSWSANYALELIERHGVTSAFLLPSMMSAMLRRRDEGAANDLSSLRAVVHGAAPCPPEVKQRMLDWLGPIVHEFYSTTEAGGTYILAGDWMRRPGTVGKPFPGIEVSILGEDDSPLPAGEVGRVALHAGGFSVHGNGASTVHQGYATPGDLGYLDEDGYLFLLGRDSEILKVGGTKVHAKEVEEVLLRHPAVLDAAVIGLPHATLGECVVAYVEVVNGATNAASVIKSVLRMARRTLPVAKAPRRVHHVDALPRTANGKIDRPALRALAEASS